MCRTVRLQDAFGDGWGGVYLSFGDGVLPASVELSEGEATDVQLCGFVAGCYATTLGCHERNGAERGILAFKGGGEFVKASTAEPVLQRDGRL